MAKGWTADLAASLGFLTRLPMPAGSPRASLAEGMRAFPIAGALIGAAFGLVLAVLAWTGLPGLAASGLALAALALVTGGLHEDGMADTADGIGGGRDRDSKLAIMRDSRIGTYGVMALVLGLIVKAACLGALAQGPATAVIALLAASGAFSRALIVWLMASTPPARSDGLAQSVGQPSDFTSRNALLVGGVITILLLLLTRGVVPAVATMVIGTLVAVLVRSVAMRQVGGHTGDICGALQFLVETAMIAAAASLS